ncbi:MAG TPA: chemotaxis protein CheX [Caldithrix abyssi]|uniref:Chemotaxis protein CheX n=1 Tax=Caldithrix abyssi TaxID=187145 RepID=A0A7V5RNA2_CALAY|nr:chemotaxis protein CheX [Caldithrix abyssi]
MARKMLGVKEVGTDDFKDLSGEIANTISGNLRKVFGREFHISVPVIVEGQARDIKLPRDIDAYIIPINWNGNKAYLVVGLE